MKRIGKSVWIIATLILCFALIPPVPSGVLAQSPQEIQAGAGPDLISPPVSHEAQSVSTLTVSPTALADYAYVSHIFTVADVVFFSYEDGTMVALYSSSGSLIWNNGGNPLNKGGHAHVAVSEGVYTAKGSRKFAVLSGDPITRYVLGYYAMDQNGYGTSTELYTWVPQLFDHCSFIVFAYQDSTQVTVEYTDTGVDIATFTLNKGDHWRTETLNAKWLHVTANKPVSALTCYDQGYLVPAANGKWSGTEFYTYVSDIRNWAQDLTVVAYDDGTAVTIEDSDTGAVIWSGTLNSGQAHVQSYPSGADKFFTITSSKKVSVYVQPWVSMTSSYHQGAYLGDSTGTRLGTDLIGSTLDGGYLYVLAYRDNTSVVVYDSRTGAFVASYTLDDGEYIQANPGNGLWRIMSNYPISAYSGWGQWNAEFAPIEFREVTAIDVTISTDKDSYAPMEDIIISAKVVDGDGNPLYPLTVSNFQAFVDGAEVTIASFAMVSATDYRLGIEAPETTGGHSITAVVNTEIGSGSGTAAINVYSISSVSLTIGGNALAQYENSGETPVYYRASSDIYPRFEIAVALPDDLRNNVKVIASITDNKGVKPGVNKKAVYDPAISKYIAEWDDITEEYPVGKYHAVAEVRDLNDNLLAYSGQKDFYLIFKPPAGYEKYVSSGTARLNQFDEQLWRPVLDDISGCTTVEDAAKNLLLFAHGIDGSYYGYWHTMMDESKSFEEQYGYPDPTHEGEGLYADERLSGDYDAYTGGLLGRFAEPAPCPRIHKRIKNAWWDNMIDFIESDFDPEDKATEKRPIGVCDDYATLFVSNARSAGIPATERTGLFREPGLILSLALFGAGHEWAEIFDGNRWVHCEATWYQVDSLYDGIRILYDAPDVYTNERGLYGYYKYGIPSISHWDLYMYEVEVAIEFDSDDYDYGDMVAADITLKNSGNIDIKRELHFKVFDKPTIVDLGPTHLLADMYVSGPSDPFDVGEEATYTVHYRLPDYGPLNDFYEWLGDRYLVVQPYFKGVEITRMTCNCFDKKDTDIEFCKGEKDKEQKKVPGLCPEWNPEITVDGLTVELNPAISSSFSFNETTKESVEAFIKPADIPVTVEHKIGYYDDYISENWYIFNPNNDMHDYTLTAPLLSIGDAVYIPDYGSVTTNQSINVSADYIVVFDTASGTDGLVEIYTFSKNMTLEEVALYDGVVEVIAAQDCTLAPESGESFLMYSSATDGGGKEFDELYEGFAQQIVGNGDTLTQFSLESAHEQISYYKVGDMVYMNLDIANNGILDETRSLTLRIAESGAWGSENIIHDETKAATIPAKSMVKEVFQYEIPYDSQAGKYRIVISDDTTEAETVFMIQAPFNVEFDVPANVVQAEAFCVNATITNLLDMPLSEISVMLDLPNDFETSESLTKDIGTLSSGESADIGWKAIATDFEDGYAPITIYIGSAEGINDIAITSLNVLRPPKLRIFPFAPAEVRMSVPFEFQADVANEGDLDLQGVSVNLSLPENVTATDDLTKLIGALASGQRKSISWEITSEREDDFCIDINATDETGVYVAHATKIVNIVKPEIELNLTNPAEIILNQGSSVIAEVKNSGELVATEVEVSLSLPPELDTTDPTDTDIGDLSPGQTKEVEWTLKGVNPGYGEITVNVTSSSVSITRGIIVSHFPLAVETDKDVYVMGDDVITTITLTNSNPEISYIGLQLDLAVEGPGGQDTFAIPIDYLSSLECRNFAVIWNSTGEPFGDYTVTVRMLEDTLVLSETSTSFTIKSLNLAPVADAGPDQTVCVIPPATTAMVTLDGSGSYDADGDPLTYNWTWDGNTAYGVNQTVELPLGITTVTLVVNDGKVDSALDTVNITVNPRPIATASSNSPVSQGAIIELYGGPAGMASYNWTGPDGWTSLSQNATRPDVTTAMAGNYTLTVTNEYGCTGANTTYVEVKVSVAPSRGGGGGGSPPTRYLTVDWDGNISRKALDSDGRLTRDLLAPCPDDSHSLRLEQGTRAPVVDGETHYLIVMRELDEIPLLPENTEAIVVINVAPTGAEFDRHVFLTLGFDELPENALNATIAYYDDVNEVWVPLGSEAAEDGVVQTSLSAAIDHFTIFGVLVELAPPPAPPGARFVVSGLSIVPRVERIWEPVTFVTRTGESVTITAHVANDGGQEGTYSVDLKLNGETVDTTMVTLGAGRSQQVSFTVSDMDYGQYEVEVAGLTGTFTTSRTINWLLIVAIIVGIALISLGVVWGRRRRPKAAQEG